MNAQIGASVSIRISVTFVRRAASRGFTAGYARCAETLERCVMTDDLKERIEEMKTAAEKADKHRWVESALAVAYIVDIDNAHAVVASVVEYNADGTIYLEFENAANHQKFIAVCNPANVSAVIAEIERLQSVVDAAVEWRRVGYERKDEFAHRIGPLLDAIDIYDVGHKRPCEEL